MKFLTPENLKIKECSISLERLPVKESEIKTEIEETIKIESVESVDETLDTFDGINDYFTLNETEKSLINEIETLAKENEENSKIFECPKCKFVFDNLNRLKLHIDSLHDKFRTKIRCPVCQVCLYGSGYERHVSLYHPESLDNEEYILAPKPYITPIRPKTTKFQPKDSENTLCIDEETSVNFNVDNPWDDIVSESGRQKRSIDAEAVLKARNACPQKSYEFKGEIMQNGRSLKSDVVSKDFRKLRHKLEFVSNLELNSFYKEFQRNHKSLKITKRLIETYKKTLSERELDLLQKQLVLQETQLVKLCKEQTEKKSYNLLHGQTEPTYVYGTKHRDF